MDGGTRGGGLALPMIEPADQSRLKVAVEDMHGGTARLVQAVPVRESFQGSPVWEGVVHVFDLVGNPKADRAYAWSSPIEGSERRRFFAVLHIPPIASPVMLCEPPSLRSTGRSGVKRQISN